MNLSPTFEEELDAMKPLLTLLLKFEDPSSRYLNVQNERFRSTPDDGLDDFMDEIMRRKTYLEALRLPSRLPHALLEKGRGMEWYRGDRDALSRQTALLALLPGESDRQGIPGGELTSRLLMEREPLSQHYPHLYAPPVPGTSGEADEGFTTLLEEVHEIELVEAGVPEEEWEEMEAKRADLEALAMAIQEVDPLYLEESLAVWDEVRRACDLIAAENGTDIEKEAAEMIRSNLAPVRSLLIRFVLESLMFRLLLEEREEDVEEQFKRWLADEGPGPGIMGAVTGEGAERSLDLLGRLSSDPLEPYDKMMDAAQNLADLGDPDASWTMVQAVLSRCSEEDFWPEMALKGVLTQLNSGDGRQVELARALLARGEEKESPMTAAAGEVAMAVSLHSLGRLVEAAEYHQRMMRALLAGRNDPDMLEIYPLAASISVEMGDKKSVRKLAGAGLRAMEEFPELDERRDQLLELRRSVDRVDKERKGARR